MLAKSMLSEYSGVIEEISNLKKSISEITFTMAAQKSDFEMQCTAINTRKQDIIRQMTQQTEYMTTHQAELRQKHLDLEAARKQAAINHQQFMSTDNTELLRLKANMKIKLESIKSENKELLKQFVVSL